jgi:hypothetical protein
VRQLMTNLKRIQAKALELARSGKFHGWRPIAFELQFDKGYEEAREWLHSAAIQDEMIASAKSLGLQRTKLHNRPYCGCCAVPALCT